MKLDDLLDEHHIPYAHPGNRHYRRGWLNVECPHCSPGSGQYYLGFNTKGCYFNCWYCGKHRLVPTLAALLGVAYKQAEELAKSLDRQYTPDYSPLPGKLVMPRCKIGPLLLPHQRYLAGRGLNPKRMVGLWGLQGIGLAGFGFAWRIFIPIVRYNRLVSWTTRAIGDRVALRYKSAAETEEAYPSKQWLYGLDNCRNGVVCCEGPVDAWTIGYGAVASLGTAYTPAQIALLAEYPIRAICFDMEPVAQQRARKLCDELAVYPGTTTNIVLDTGTDPNNASPREIRQIRKHFLD